MTWGQFSQSFWLEPDAGQPPEALVVLLDDAGGSAVSLTSLVACWVPTVPRTVFAWLAEVEQPISPADSLLPQANWWQPLSGTDHPRSLTPGMRAGGKNEN